jgi:hypothetical protein
MENIREQINKVKFFTKKDLEIVSEDISSVDISDAAKLILLTKFIIDGRFSPEYLSQTAGNLKHGFISFAKSMGYQIDEEFLDYKFDELVSKIKSVIGKA